MALLEHEDKDAILVKSEDKLVDSMNHAYWLQPPPVPGEGDRWVAMGGEGAGGWEGLRLPR